MHRLSPYSTFFFFNDTATTEIYTLSLHDALPIYGSRDQSVLLEQVRKIERMYKEAGKDITVKVYDAGHAFIDRKSTRLNSSHVRISYAVFCLKKKNITFDIVSRDHRLRS